MALPDHAAFLTRALRVLPQELARQVLPDGSHAERSPGQLMAALQDLTEIRALLQAAQAQPPQALGSAIERMAPALRALRHGDGGLALFNGTKEESAALVELVLAQAGRGGRAPSALTEGGFQRLQAGRSVLIVDCGAPAPAKIDRFAHAGTLSFELSVGRDRMIVNCGAAPAAGAEWRDASRATAAHSTLVIADTNSSELKPEGLGRRPEQRRGAAPGGGRRLLAGGEPRRLPQARSARCTAASSIWPRAARTSAARTWWRRRRRSPIVVRFHLHPNVDASLQQDGRRCCCGCPRAAAGGCAPTARG